MASVQSIQELVKQFAWEEISAAEFANSFTPLLSSAVKSADQPARDLAIAVHAYISHFFHGLISEQEFRSDVATLCCLDSIFPVTVSMPTMSERVEAFSVDPQGQLIPA